MPDIFDEVAEDLRHEKATALARRYGIWVLLALILALVGVGAQQGWQSWQGRQANKAAQQYLTLTSTLDGADTPLTAGQQETAAAALQKFAATAPEGYKTIANLRAAALYASAKQPAKAAALWNAVAADSAADPLLRDVATLYWAQNAIGTAPDATVLARLQPLALDANPYHALARETQGLVYLREKNVAQAKALFSQIATDATAPSSVRTRAQALLASLNG